MQSAQDKAEKLQEAVPADLDVAVADADDDAIASSCPVATAPLEVCRFCQCGSSQDHM